jgi:glycosyltransferase involved in cell wall biosynthesis
MRILSILLQYPPARRIGAELYDHELHKALTKAGHTVQVLTTEEPTSKLPAWDFEGIAVNDEVQGDYDLILTHIDLRQKAWYIARLNKLTHLPIVAIQHNNAPSTVLAEKLYQWAGIIYNSEHSKSLGSNQIARKTVLIPPVKPVGKTPVSTGTNIVQISLNQIKGGGTFWETAKNNPEQNFIAVQGGWGEQEKPYLIPRNVTLLPHMEDLTEVWKDSALLLLPSFPLESWAMVAAEAGRHGIPTLTFNDIAGVLENIGDTGHAVPRTKSLKLPETYGPSKEVQQWFSKQATKHRKQLTETVKFLEGFSDAKP